jgi:endonuclease YncB( thermonuclease family)
MSPVIPFRRRSRYPRVPFALGVLAAIGAAAIAAWMIWQRSRVSPSGQIIEVIDGDTVRLNGAVYRLVGFDTPERGDKARCDDERRRGSLSIGGRDAGNILISEGLAHPYVCGATSCPQRRPWC